MAKTAIKETDVTQEDIKETGRIPYRREFVKVTPPIAKSMLEAIHPDQRNRKPGKIEQFAQDIKTGSWREDTEDTILFDWNGLLIDGQNRLHAVREAGKAVSFWVVWGVDPAVMAVKDTGGPRSIADSLRIAGHGEGMSQQDLLTLGAIARRQIHWEAGRRTTGSMKSLAQATHSDIAEILKRQPDIYGAAKIGNDAAKSTRPALMPAAAYGFFWLNANRVDSETAYQWQSFWLTPEELPGGSPITVVRERFFRHKMAQTAKSGYGERRADVLSVDEQIALLIRAWTFFLAGRTVNMTRLQIARGKLTNENFPTFVSKAQALKDAERYERELASRAAKATGTAFSG